MVEAIEDLPTRKKVTNAELHHGNDGCIIDKMVGKCGPYRYHVTKHKGKQTWKYLGRTDRFEIGLVKDEDFRQRNAGELKKEGRVIE